MWITDFIADNGLRPASWADLTGCHTSTVTYTPSTDTANAKPGDLAVVIIRRNNDQITPPAVTIPAGWKRFLTGRPSATRGQGRALADVVYKFLTAGDIITTHTFVHGGGVNATNDLCAAAFVFPDAHPDIPLDGLQWEWMNPLTSSPYIMRWAATLPNCIAPEDYYTFNLLGWGGPSGESNVLEPSDVVQIPYPTDALYAQYRELLTYHTFVTLRKATAGMQNLFASEDWRSVMTNWTAVNLGTFQHGVTSYSSGELAYALLIPNTTLGRHYAYQDVTLEAGKFYTYTIQVYPYGGGYSPYVNPALGVVPPSGEANEFGAACTGYGQSMILDDTQAAYNDPQGGRTIWWWAGAQHGEPDGLPNYMQNRVSLVFQAQESGVHQIRLYVHNSDIYQNVWANIVHNSASPRVYITRISLYEGVTPGTWAPTSGGALYSQYQPAPALYAKFGGASTCGHLKFWVNPKGPLPPAIMHSVQQQIMPELEDATYGLQYNGGNIGGGGGNDNAAEPISSLRLVYPTYGGVKRKYYAEMSVISTWGNIQNNHGIWVTPLYGPNADTEAGYGGEGYGWPFSGAWTIPYVPFGSLTTTKLTSIAASPSANSAFGVVVDYSNDNVRFYKDGVIHAVLPMTTVYPAADSSELPFRVFMAGGYSGYQSGRIYFNARLGGGFSARPIGTVPWDIANGGVPTDAALTPEGVLVTKAVDQTRTDSAPAFADSADDELFYDLAGSKKYYFEFMVRVEGSTGVSTWDAIVNYTGSGSKQMMASLSCDVADNPAGYFDGHLWADNSEAELTQTTTRQVRVFFYYAAPRIRDMVVLSGYISTGVAGGRLRLLWKPSATNASGCKVLAGSTLRIEECT